MGPRSLRVYPRVCGGARGEGAPTERGEGLSPRVRGSRCLLIALLPGIGSIPACAGEPTSYALFHSARRVYPRVCGGADFIRSVSFSSKGLSPRVRGSQVHPEHNPTSDGSIPACAGEPYQRRAVRVVRRVYPRVCGGALIARPSFRAYSGLSPRVRGSPRLGRPPDALHGSIPACAGEPRPQRPSPASTRVYPRVCGGADLLTADQFNVQGLSPRVRGSRSPDRRSVQRAGSIPACAGEPIS